MSTSEQLRQNVSQHSPKNKQSKKDDKKVAEAMGKVVHHLNERFNLKEEGYFIEYAKSIKLSELMDMIKSHNSRKEFAELNKNDSFMKPDGGILILRKKKDKNYKRIVLAVEMKRQGTNDQRLQEGKPKQAQGNAIERLGKNLIGLRAALKYEKVTPFICFGWGIDFTEGSSIRDRIITLNEFYPLNKIFVHKKEDGYSPVSMFFRIAEWDVNELFTVMKEVAEASITAYIY